MYSYESKNLVSKHTGYNVYERTFKIEFFCLLLTFFGFPLFKIRDLAPIEIHGFPWTDFRVALLFHLSLFVGLSNNFGPNGKVVANEPLFQVNMLEMSKYVQKLNL